MFPRTITSNDKELVVVSEFVNSHFGESSDNLLLRREIRALLELKVTNRTAQSEVAIDTAKVDETASGANSCLLALILGLVVEGEWLCAALDTENGS
jgi:hypothetical protein